MKRITIALAAAGLLGSHASVHAQIKLKHKFTEGRKPTKNNYVRV